MCGSRAVQQMQSVGNETSRERWLPRTAHGAPAALLALWSDAGGHNRLEVANLCLFWGRTQCQGRGYGHLERYIYTLKVPEPA